MAATRGGRWDTSRAGMYGRPCGIAGSARGWCARQRTGREIKAVWKWPPTRILTTRHRWQPMRLWDTRWSIAAFTFESRFDPEPWRALAPALDRHEPNRN